MTVHINYNTTNRTCDIFHGDLCIFYGTPEQVEEYLKQNNFVQVGLTTWRKQ